MWNDICNIQITKHTHIIYIIHKHETDKHTKTPPPKKNSDHLKQKHTINIVDTNKTQHKTHKTTLYI